MALYKSYIIITIYYYYNNELMRVSSIASALEQMSRADVAPPPPA